jgi:hypothetical protein
VKRTWQVVYRLGRPGKDAPIEEAAAEPVCAFVDPVQAERYAERLSRAWGEQLAVHEERWERVP